MRLSGLRPDFTSKLEHVLAFGTLKFYIAPYDKIKHELVNLSSNCDVNRSKVSIRSKKDANTVFVTLKIRYIDYFFLQMTNKMQPSL